MPKGCCQNLFGILFFSQNRLLETYLWNLTSLKLTTLGSNATFQPPKSTYKEGVSKCGYTLLLYPML